MYMGIPYALVDRENPFGPAHPNPQFSGIFEAIDDTAVCPQRNEFNNELAGTLDCLHVNVYVPDTITDKKLPVLVWIYGGAFTIGFAGRYVYGPKFLVRHDVILVTLNYRVGPYGFMCTGTERVPGNQGIKDQLLALEWVRDNIQAFGGDVENINVFGQSAGAMSIEIQLLSTQEKLFKRAILHSGSVARPGIVIQPNKDTPIKLATRLGYNAENLDDALDFLSNEDVLKVINASTSITTLFRPCYENSFLQYPLNYHNDQIRSTDILIGYTDQETLLFHLHSTTEDLQASDIFNETINIFNLNTERYARIMRRFYIGDEEITESVRWEIINYHSDFTFAYPVHRSVNKFLNNGQIVYHFIFSYSGGRNFIKVRQNVTEGGAAHTDDLGYLFDMELFDSNPEGTDKIMVDRMTTMWTNFIKYGDPTPEPSDLLPVRWLPATRETLHCLHIDSDITTSIRPDHDRYALWDLLFKLFE
ncbi:bile salt-activated lipase-like [Leptidea sinapis]|uniref:bile salt-activated lipase-like n=1 Tax=Leptidea sinapis TaxID=189913 RepID=UPI0021C2976F|nr:bile salt-activated lipase-like [Leptidea sinapis]